MPQRDVRQFARERQRQARFVRQHVDQAAADDDGVADREGLKGRGQQHAAMRLDVQLRRHDQVVDHGIENFIHRTRRRQKSAFFEARQQVLFGLPLPGPLAFERRNIFRRVLILTADSLSIRMLVSSSILRDGAAA